MTRAVACVNLSAVSPPNLHSGVGFDLAEIPDMAVRPITRYPEPVLLVPCREVADITAAVRKLIADMMETMHAAPGIGLAANQIGVDLRITVIDLSVGKNPDDLKVLINPVLLVEEGKFTDEEGCLSIPDFQENVTRPRRVVAEALDIDGKRWKIDADGLLARAITHEVDHLDGKLFLSRLSPLKRNFLKKKIRKKIRDGEWVDPSP